MTDKWDYQLRRVEIAWEIAKIRIEANAPRATRSRENYKRMVAEALMDAWEVVDDTFPRCD